MNSNARGMYRDLVAQKLERFDMYDIYHCGTPLCILGHALHRMGKLDEFIRYENSDEGLGILRSDAPLSKKAFKWLGVSPEAGYALCFPGNRTSTTRIWSGLNSFTSQPDAAEALKRACELSKPAKKSTKKVK